MQDMGYCIFVQSDDRATDGYTSLRERASKTVESKLKDEYARKACEQWLDVRSFGQVFAFKSDKSGVSVGVRGPVTFHQAVSCSPVTVESMQITKSVNSEPGDKKSSDTMGQKHRIGFALYKVKGSINVQLAEKTGFSQEDAGVIKGVPQDPVCKRCFLRASGRVDGSYPSVLVGSIPAVTVSIRRQRYTEVLKPVLPTELIFRGRLTIM